jgi:hypothetical protein
MLQTKEIDKSPQVPPPCLSVVDLFMRKRTYQYANVQRYLHFNRLRTHHFAGSQ